MTKGRIPFAACRYWRLNHPICCVQRSRDSQCFSIGITTPKSCLSPWRNLDPPSNARFPWANVSHQPNSISVASAVFVQLTRVPNGQTVTDRQTHKFINDILNVCEIWIQTT